jgi:ABC-type dipeptide/oligopeptide/nickel transport system permease subunit
MAHLYHERAAAAHWLGTTQTEQDVFSELLAGARVTLLVGFAAGAIATVLAVLVGVTAGSSVASATSCCPCCPTSSSSSRRCRW